MSRFPFHPQMQLEHLAELQPYGQRRVERGHGLLEDHGDPPAPYGAHLLALGRVLQEIRAFEQRSPARDEAGRGADELHHRELTDSLAASALPDKSHDLTVVDVVGDVVDGGHRAAFGVELDFQVLHPQQRLHRASCVFPTHSRSSP